MHSREIKFLLTSRQAVLTAITLLFLIDVGCGAGTSSGSTRSSSAPGTDRRVGTTSVLTYHNDNYRSGLNQSETLLTPANVRPSTFGKLAGFPVKGYVYAQPLYVPNVNLGSAELANLVIVATEHDQLYAFDVDAKTLVWHTDYLASGDGASTLSTDDVSGCQDLIPEIGITGTPVIDPVTLTLYVVVRTKELVDGATVFYQRLHAVNISTGQDTSPPAIITGPPTGYAATGTATFDPLLNNQRSALTLAHGQVVVAWASHCDFGPYFGWLMSFDESTLQPTAYWTPVPNSTEGGIWMSGGGPSVDASGDLYVPVGNGGSGDPIAVDNNFGSSVVRLHWSLTNGFSVADYFAPDNYQTLDDIDDDLGTSEALLLPDQISTQHPHLLLVADKLGNIYLLDRDNLGKWQPNINSQIVQSFPTPGIGFASPLFWNSTLYFAGARDVMRAYSFDPVSQQFNSTPASSSSGALDNRGSTPSLSASGDTNALLWIVNGSSGGQNAVLHALLPGNLSNDLYNSSMMADRDTAGIGVKFVVPTVADGFVFVGAQGEVDMYGLLN